MKSKRKEQPAITARPKPVSDEMKDNPDNEPGLSVDPEDLGAHFLIEATETGTRRRPEELAIVEGAPSDDALPGPNFDPDQTVWESTIDLSLQEEGQATHVALADSDSEEDDDDTRATLDLTQDSVHEASLLDEEGDTLGEVESPELITDDTKHEAHHRSRAKPQRSP